MRRALIAAVIPLAFVASMLGAAGVASAGTSKAAYSWHVADALLEEAAGSPPVAIAMASNGDTVELDGTGTLNAADKTASGGGQFVHKRADGSVDPPGTFTVNGLVSFQFYGCSDQVIPGVTLCGGLAKLDVTLTPSGTSLQFPATLWIDCLIGDNIPAGGEPARDEGIRLNVKDLINFTQTVPSGLTLFIPEG
jgi:hypothetical protein